MIELAFPHDALWPNKRAHWAVKARETKKHRHNAHWAMKVVLNEPPFFPRRDGPVQLTWMVHPKTSGPAPDKDNCVSALKAYQDGISDALGVNDRDFATPVILIGERRKGGAVRLEI